MNDMSLPTAWRDDPLIAQQVRSFWNNHIHDWKVARSEPGTKAFFEEIEAYRFEKLSYLPQLVDFSGYAGQEILDVGCGVGNDLSRFAKSGSQVTGIDLAEHSIELARNNFRQRGLKGQLLLMDGEQMEFSDASFDMIYCHTVLHFTPNPAQMVREIYRVLKPGGRAILMTVNRHSWLNLMHRLFKVEIDHLDAPVFYKFTIREFRALLEPFGSVEIVPERFPVRTKVHRGLKAKLYNTLFVDLFNALPRAWVRCTGHHLMAFANKEPRATQS
jgi:ubiquinone/menaquinone biosynthesis C-methylase UbiE